MAQVQVASWQQLADLPVGTMVQDPVTELSGVIRHSTLGPYLPLGDGVQTRIMLYPMYEGGEFGGPMLATLPA